MDSINDITLSDVLHHHANNSEGWSDGVFYFPSPDVIDNGTKMMLAVMDEKTEEERAWVLTAVEI